MTLSIATRASAESFDNPRPRQPICSKQLVLALQILNPFFLNFYATFKTMVLYYIKYKKCASLIKNMFLQCRILR